MSNKQHSKVRVVRCPRCAKILLEPEHVPLYSCGGCSTILQVKNYRGSHKDTALSSHEQDVPTKNSIMPARDGGESSGSSRRSSTSGEHSSAQDEGSDQGAVKNSRFTSGQNGDPKFSDHTLLSKESSDLKKNGENENKQDKFVLKDHNALSQESSYIENKENGESNSNLDQNKGRDWDAVSRSEQSGPADSAHHTALSEEPTFFENKENAENYDSKYQVANGYPTVLENKEPEQLPLRNLAEEDDNGQDGHSNDLQQLAMVREDASSVIESPAIENPAENHASDHEKETGMMHLVEKHLHQDQHEIEQFGAVNSAKHSSSLTEAPDIEKSTQWSSETPEEHDDDSDHKVLEETRKMHLVHEQFGQDILRNEISCHDTNESEEMENSGKEHGNEIDPNDFVECIAERIECLKLSSVATLSTEIFQGENDDSVHGSEDSVEACGERDSVFPSSRATELKSLHEMNAMDSAVYMDSEDGSLLKEVPRATTKRSPAYEGSVSSFDGYDDQVPEQPAQDGEEVCSTNNAVAGYDGAEESHEWNSIPSQRMVYKNPRVQTREIGSGSSSMPLDEKLKTNMIEGQLEENGIPRRNSKFRPNRSPAYDGSVSSFDGNDDQVPEQPAQVGENFFSANNAVAGFDVAEGSPEWNNIPTQRMIYRNPRVQTQEKGSCSSSMPLDEKLKRSMIEEQLQENVIPRRNSKFRPNKDRFLPRVPYHSRSSEMAFETGSSSSYAIHDEPPSHHMHHHPYRRRFSEAPLWREKEFIPSDYNYETSGEIYDRPMYHAYNDRRRRAESWSQSGTLPRMPYSGEMYNGNSSYMHRYPDDRRWSAQLPPPAACCHQGVYMGRGWETRWDPYDSYPISPHCVESEASCTWGHDTVSLSDDQRYKDQIMKRLYLREKRQALKRQFLPIAAGAPFITCYFCFHILQLPEDFLLSKRRRRRTHKLKCGACSKILEFSLENEGCLAPCETNVDRNANLSMSSHVNHSRKGSLQSIDGRDLLSLDSFRASNREKRKLVPGSSRNEERMEVFNNDASHPVRGREAKVTWQVPARSKSPLHSLMGYSSPQDLLVEREADDAL